MNELTLSPLVILAVWFFLVGAVGAAWRRSLLAILIALQLMLMAGELAFLSFASERSTNLNSNEVTAAAQGVALSAIFVGLVQFAVGFMLIRRITRDRKTFDLEKSSMLRG